jgi:hypothetical protein
MSSISGYDEAHWEMGNNINWNDGTVNVETAYIYNIETGINFHFDGKHFTISNANFSPPASGAATGIIGSLAGGVIKNIVFDNCYINCIYQVVANKISFVTCNLQTGIIDSIIIRNCSISYNPSTHNSAADYISFIAAYQAGGTIRRCLVVDSDIYFNDYSNNTTTTPSCIGGIVGYSYLSSASDQQIEKCAVKNILFNSNSYSATKNVYTGSIIGCVYGTIGVAKNIYITDCYAYNNLFTRDIDDWTYNRIGGFVGATSINNTYPGRLIVTTSYVSVQNALTVTAGELTLTDSRVYETNESNVNYTGLFVDTYESDYNDITAISLTNPPISVSQGNLDPETTFSTFDFETIWDHGSLENNGYPYLRFEGDFSETPPEPPSFQEGFLGLIKD